MAKRRGAVNLDGVPRGASHTRRGQAKSMVATPLYRTRTVTSRKAYKRPQGRQDWNG